MLAHQGGWDEILFVAVPMAFIAWVLWFTRQRVVRAAARNAAEGGTSGSTAPGADGAPAEPPLTPPG